MGYGIMPWHVNLDRLSQYSSSAGELKLVEVEKAKAVELANYDRQNLSPVPILQTIQDLLNGEHNHPEFGFQYGYALQFLCSFCGNILDNHEVYPMSVRCFEEIDEAFATIGVEDLVTMDKLVSSGPPVELPIIDDFPDIGHLTATQCKSVFHRFFDGQGNSKKCNPNWPAT